MIRTWERPPWKMPFMGEGEEAGGAGLGAGLEDWADDDEVEAASHRQPALDHQGAGPSATSVARGGVQKRRDASTYFGSRPKKSKGSTAATKRDEAAA